MMTQKKGNLIWAAFTMSSFFLINCKYFYSNVEAKKKIGKKMYFFFK